MRDRLETERLVLRQLTLDDAKALSHLGGDLDIARMTGSFPHPFPLLSAEFKIMHMQQLRRRGLAYPYAITENGGGLMGITDLFRRDENSAFELGYWIGKPYWGHGYMTESCQALITEAQKTLGVTRLVAGVYEDNPASQQVLFKLGFEHNGTEGMYFSMARLQKANSLSFQLDLAAQDTASALHARAKPVNTDCI